VALKARVGTPAASSPGGSSDPATGTVMHAIYAAFALFLLLNLLGGLVRILRGPTRSDRLLAAQLFGTTGVAFLLTLAEGMEAPPLRDTALVFALLAPVNAIVFTRSASGSGPVDREGAPDA
jgi:multicomponent Na+:H+ antiporter subunit F